MPIYLNSNNETCKERRYKMFTIKICLSKTDLTELTQKELPHFLSEHVLLKVRAKMG